MSPSQGLNLGLPITSQMLLTLSHQDSYALEQRIYVLLSYLITLFSLLFLPLQ